MTSQKHNIHTTNNVHKGVVILAHTQGWQSVKRTHTSATLHLLYHEGKRFALGQCKQRILIHRWQAHALRIHASLKAGLCFDYHTCRHKELKFISQLWKALRKKIYQLPQFWFWRNIHEDFLYRWLQMAGLPITCKSNP